MFVFDGNSHAVHKITSGEEALVYRLFANFDTTWGHPALQDRLRRAGKQPRSQSVLNGMTLFSTVWTASKLPEFQSYKVVWDAMRAHLENDGVLAAVVSRFNAYVSRKGNSAHLDRVNKSKAQRETYPKILPKMDCAMSTDGEDAKCQTRRTRPSNLSPENPHHSNRVLSTAPIYDCSPSPPIHASSSSKHLFSQSPTPQLGPSEWASCYEDEELYDQSTHSSDPHSDLHPHPFASSCFGPGPAQAQLETHVPQETGHFGAVPNATVFSYHTHRMEYEQKLIQPPEQRLQLYPPSIASPSPFSEAYSETQQSLPEFGASMPSILTPRHFHQHEAQLNSSSTIGQAYWQNSTVPLPYLPYHNQSSTIFSLNSTVSDNSAFVPPQNNYWRGYTDGKFAEGYASDAYKMQDE
ncbi:hypothetical protein GG344DRAFT_76733 [Lentinula edodes]|nr:hypothetical protein GG344DRAFT_76733 [Lentinula edodes]